jgi:hypothetical protein
MESATPESQSPEAAGKLPEELLVSSSVVVSVVAMTRDQPLRI